MAGKTQGAADCGELSIYMGATMNRDDIERMAREAKGHAYTNRYTPGETAFAFSIDRLEHFVSLVSAAERVRMCEQFGLSKELAHESAKDNEAD